LFIYLLFFKKVASRILIENFLENVKVHIEKLIDYFYSNFSDKTIDLFKYIFLSIVAFILIYLILTAFAELLLLGILFILYLIYKKL
tara:strand:+ start:179 stop:439 length:261 start_codon:yes stop_codon:yes gene_type:complete